MKTKNLKSFKSELKRQIWEREDYAKTSPKEVRRIFFANPSLVKLLEYSKEAEKILDCGCGDGRIIDILWRKDAEFTGIDISKRAIRAAKSKFRFKKNLKFATHDLEKIDLKNETFDLVYSVYTLEHTDNPEKVITNMARLVKRNGKLVIICPNYGSPFQPSGMNLISGDKGILRALKIFLKSHLYLVKEPENLEWNKVYPKALEKREWRPDWDTTNEPYIQSLLTFLNNKKLQVVEYSSGLEKTQSYPKKSLLSWIRFFFEFLGKLGLPPYKYYGPTLFVVAQK